VALEKRYGLPFPLLEWMLRNEEATYRPEAYRRAYADWRSQVTSASA
jgi:hypothetical protein